MARPKADATTTPPRFPFALLRQVYLPPFQATVDAGVATFMSAFDSLNEVPASANAFTLTQVLRKEWDFKGFVVSDWNSIGELIPQGVAEQRCSRRRQSAPGRRGHGHGEQSLRHHTLRSW